MKVLKRVLILLLSLFLLLVAVVAGVGYSYYKDLNTSVNSEDFTHYLSPESRPTKNPSISKNGTLSKGAMNYLVVGSDSRDGENSSYGYGENIGQRSDTTMIVHLSENRDNVDVISIPRDTIVDIPSCMLSDGSKTQEMADTQFNTAFALGDTDATSIACTVATVEKNTNVFIDGYVLVDFSGFESVVDALGGVTMNIPYDMVSSSANLDLKAGEQTLNGEEALAYARARTFEVGYSDGSDLSRIDRQQELMKAIITQATSTDTLTNPNKVFDLAKSSLGSLTFSPEIADTKSLSELAYSLRSVPEDGFNFYTTPTAPWVYDTNRVVWTDNAELMWEALRNDTPIKDTGEF